MIWNSFSLIDMSFSEYWSFLLKSFIQTQGGVKLTQQWYMTEVVEYKNLNPSFFISGQVS